MKRIKRNKILTKSVTTGNRSQTNPKYILWSGEKCPISFTGGSVQWMLLQLMQCPSFVLNVWSEPSELLNNSIKPSPNCLVWSQCCRGLTQLSFRVGNRLVQLRPFTHIPTNNNNNNNIILKIKNNNTSISKLPVPRACEDSEVQNESLSTARMQWWHLLHYNRQVTTASKGCVSTGSCDGADGFQNHTTWDFNFVPRHTRKALTQGCTNHFSLISFTRGCEE